jgi:hypothetical protein
LAITTFPPATPYTSEPQSGTYRFGHPEVEHPTRRYGFLSDKGIKTAIPETCRLSNFPMVSFGSPTYRFQSKHMDSPIRERAPSSTKWEADFTVVRTGWSRRSVAFKRRLAAQGERALLPTLLLQARVRA